jgi:hypothetical protein
LHADEFLGVKNHIDFGINKNMRMRNGATDEKSKDGKDFF